MLTGSPARTHVVAVLGPEHDDGDVARVLGERLLERGEVGVGAIEHQRRQVVALLRDHHAGAGGESFTQPAHEPVGKPVADDLHLVGVILGERVDEAADEPSVLRRRGDRPHEQQGREEGCEDGAH